MNDGITNEMYEMLIECVEILHKCLNNELNSSINLESWSKSIIIMLPN